MVDESVITETNAAPPFAVADEFHAFSASDVETIHVPAKEGVDVTLYVIEQPFGWLWGAEAKLPDWQEQRPLTDLSGVVATRSLALAASYEYLRDVAKGQMETGSKANRKEARKLFDWAVASLTRSAAHQAKMAAAEVFESHEAKQIAKEEALHALHARAIAPEFRVVPLERLHESLWNPRTYYPEDSLQRLATSMRESGFWPEKAIIVRPQPEGNGYEIAAGHRRYRAARIAGFAEVPVQIQLMDDAKFLDLLNFDNGGAEDVHPFHEAAGWKQWMERTGHGVKDIAARIGQGIGYVYQRLKYCDLTPEAQRAFLDGKFTPRHAVLIARQIPEVQADALKFLEPQKWAPDKLPSTRELDVWLHRDIYEDLSTAPFDTQDGMLLAGAGSCTGCSKRAANVLGYEAPDSNDNSGADPCTDSRCFDQKLTNHLSRIERSFVEQNQPLVKISQSYNTKKKGVLPRTEWEPASDNQRGAVTGLVVEGARVGQVMSVKARVKEAEPRSGGTLGSASGQSSAEMQKAREADAEKRKQLQERELKVRRAILEAVRPKISTITRADLLVLLEDLLRTADVDILCSFHGIEAANSQAGDDALLALLPKLPEPALFQILLETTVVDEFDDWQLHRDPEKLYALAKRYKVDAGKIRREIEEPAKETLGGTRKAVINKLPALEVTKTAKKAPVKATPAKKAATVKKATPKPAVKKAKGKK